MQKGNFSVIIKGTHKNKKIPFPASVKNHTAVTPQKVKEAVFQIIDNNISDPQSALFIDLFSGSGQIGFEAISRGFFKCIFFDISPERLYNLKSWSRINMPADFDKYTFEKKDGVKEFQNLLINKQGFVEKYIDLNPVENIVIFADPPYGLKYKKKVIIEYLIDAVINCLSDKDLFFILIIQTNQEDFRNSKYNELDIENTLRSETRIVRKFNYGRHRILSFRF